MGVHEIAELLGQTVWGDAENFYIPCPLAAHRHPSGENPGRSFSLREVRGTDAVGFCWSCKWTGNMRQLAKEFDAVGDPRAAPLRALVGAEMSFEQLHDYIEKQERRMAKASKKSKEVITLPDRFVPIKEGQWKRCPFEVQQRYGVMWDEQLGPVCVVRDIDGNLLGWQHRNPHFDPSDKKSPKYLNNEGYRRGMHLYGLNVGTSGSTVVVSEGASDAHAIAAVRPDLCSVTSLGADIGVMHLKKLATLFSSIILAFDNDAAGTRALNKTLLLLAKYPSIADIRVMTYGGLAAKDPDELKPSILKKFLDEAVPVWYTDEIEEVADPDLIPDELEDDESSFDGDPDDASE